MPLFMLVCGYFSLNAFHRGFKEFIYKKTIQLLVPAFVVSFSSIALYFAWGELSQGGARTELIGGLWFLKTLFACYLIVYIAKKTSMPDWLCCLTTVVLFYVIPKGSSMQVNYLLSMFWIGYFVRKYHEQFEHIRMVVTITATIGFASLIMLGIPTYNHELTRAFILQQPLEVLEQYACSLCGSFMVIGMVYYIDQCFQESWVQKYIGEIGRYTLGIYAMQTIVLERIIHYYFTALQGMNYTWWMDFVVTPLIGIAVTVICYYLVKGLSRFKVMNLLFFGNQY